MQTQAGGPTKHSSLGSDSLREAQNIRELTQSLGQPYARVKTLGYSSEGLQPTVEQKSPRGTAQWTRCPHKCAGLEPT